MYVGFCTCGFAMRSFAYGLCLVCVLTCDCGCGLLCWFAVLMLIVDLA